ncbi:MAG: AAA family ATPase [Desulfobacterales bacterium]|nr:AAA family ATPase [Desulfobacterales bacterium]
MDRNTFRRSRLIIGSRRSGKTTLLKRRYPDWSYATLDDLDYLAWAKRDPKGLIGHLGDKAVIDETQRLPMLTVAVKYAVDNEKARFLMTGSSTLGLLDAAADSLAGRIDIISLPAVCWGEELGSPTHSFFNDQAPLPQIKEAVRFCQRGRHQPSHNKKIS